LHGVPITVKESWDVAGLPSTFGLPHLRNNIAGEDALAVSRLKQAGGKATKSLPIISISANS
jgi:amidase